MSSLHFEIWVMQVGDTVERFARCATSLLVHLAAGRCNAPTWQEKESSYWPASGGAATDTPSSDECHDFIGLSGCRLIYENYSVFLSLQSNPTARNDGSNLKRSPSSELNKTEDSCFSIFHLGKKLKLLSTLHSSKYFPWYRQEETEFALPQK